MPSKLERHTLSGAEKAAIFLLSLGEQQATTLFSKMEDEEIREISQHLSALGSVPSEVVQRLFIDFSEQITSVGSLVGGHNAVQRLLTKALKNDRVEQIMEEIRGPAGRTMWDKLGNVNEAVLASYLKNEYPQTVAVVLSQIKSDHAARVLATLPEDVAIDVVMRMLRMHAVQKDILADVEHTLRTEFMSHLARTHKGDSYERMADIFNTLDRAGESRLLSALEKHDKEAADHVRALMFTFEDLIKLDPGGAQTLLRKFGKSKLAITLKGASEPVRNLFFSNMSERACKLLREEMQDLGPVRLRDVDEAQQAMVKLAKELAANDEIMIVDLWGDDELVY